MTDAEFNRLITQAMDELPAKYIKGLQNVAIVMADEPSMEQLRKMKIDKNHSLLGLYEGIPLTQRGAGYNLVLPDKITLFKNTIEQNGSGDESVFEVVKRTLWHEIAHYYGLSHADIDRIQKS
jgi:predicted Zn-dependent protease with MMP-like domain